MAADGGPFFFCEGDPPYAKHSFPSGLWRQAGPHLHRGQQHFLVFLVLWLLPDHLPAGGGLHSLSAGASQRPDLHSFHCLCFFLGHGQRPHWLSAQGAHHGAGGGRGAVRPHPPHPRGASLFHGPVLLPGAPGLFLPGLHVHLRGEPAGAQLQRAALELRPAAQRGLFPLYDRQLYHLLPAAHGGGGLHLLADGPAHRARYCAHLLRAGARRQAA